VGRVSSFDWSELYYAEFGYKMPLFIKKKNLTSLHLIKLTMDLITVDAGFTKREK